MLTMLGFYLLMVFVATVAGDAKFFTLYTLFSLLYCFLLYASPAAFIMRDRTLMVQIPVLPMERIVFYSVYSLIYIPLIVQGWYYLLSIVGGLFWTYGDIWHYTQQLAIDKSGMELTPSFLTMSGVVNVISYIGMICVAMWITFTKRHNVLVKMIVASFVYLISIGFIGGIIGAVFGFYEGFTGQDYDPGHFTSIEFTIRISNWILMVSMVLSVVYLTVACFLMRKLYKRFQHPQIVA